MALPHLPMASRKYFPRFIFSSCCFLSPPSQLSGLIHLFSLLLSLSRSHVPTLSALPCETNALQYKREKTQGDYSVEKLVLGTHTSDGEQNHLMIAEARIPNDNAQVDGTKYQDREGGMRAFAHFLLCRVFLASELRCEHKLTLCVSTVYCLCL